MADILIIDDDPVICDVLVQMMNRISHQGRFALSGGRGLELAQNGLYDIVFLDVNLPDANGLDLIKKIKSLPSNPEVIIITGESDPDGAEMAIASGAWNYLEKPFLRQEIALQVKRALEFRREKGRVSSPGQLKRNDIIGETPMLETSLEQVNVAAYSDAQVMISGEAGTGKELFAKTIHLNSDRRDGNFILADCAAMTDELALPMLFGTAGGAENGGKPGFLSQAHGGTLVLDDVGKLPLDFQKSLLEALESQSFTPLGQTTPVVADFRTMAISQEDLSARAEAGEFRKDLLFFLKGIHIDLPPLRQLGQDIVRLAIHYMERCCKKYQINPKGASPEFLGIVSEYPWPGNVQELINAMDKAVASALHEPTLYSIHLPAYVKETIINKNGRKNEALHKQLPCLDFENGDQIPQLKSYLSSVEEQYLICLWKETQENVNLACEISGISRSSLYDRLNKYQIR